MHDIGPNLLYVPGPATVCSLEPQVCISQNSVTAPCLLQAAYLLRNDGLFVGSSAAMNCVGAVKVARSLGPGHTVATVLCDGGQRYT